MLASSFSTRFLLRKNRRSRSLPPLGATCSLPHFRFAQMWPRIFPRGLPGYVPLFPGWPRARTPALAPIRSHFAPRNRAAGHRPHRGRCFAVPVTAPPRRAPNGKTPALAPIRSHFAPRNRAAGHRPHRGRCFAVPVTAPPRRAPNGKTPALAPIRSHFAPRNRAAGHRPHRGRCFAVPVTAPPRRVPNGKTPALAPVRSHFACGETARPVVAPAGGNVLATPFSLRSNVAPRSHPGACSRSVAFRSAKPRGRSSAPPGPMFCRPRHGSAAPGPQRQNPGPPRFQSGFFCAKTGGRIPPLSDGGALTKSENIILCASSCHPPRSPYPHCTLPHVRFSGIGQKKKPQRKTAVPPYPICRTEKQSV